jgi:hypothetical protein
MCLESVVVREILQVAPTEQLLISFVNISGAEVRISPEGPSESVF